MRDGRPHISAALKRDLILEVGARCAMPQCRESVLERAHLIDFAASRDDSFGNQIMLCPACHSKHTRGYIDAHLLRVLKARLAWENDRYTVTECNVLSMFAQNKGTYFSHPSRFGQCMRNLSADGYIEWVRQDQIDGVAMDVFRLTTTGRLFVKGWPESGASPVVFTGPSLRPR